MMRIVVVATLASVAMLVACSADDTAARRKAAGPSADLPALMRVASADHGQSLFARCAACHAIRPGAPDRNGPNLSGVMTSAIGQNSARFAYTAALQQAGQRLGGRWTPARMDAWLASPSQFAPGTSMGFAGLSDPLDRADVIAYLQAQSRPAS